MVFPPSVSPSTGSPSRSFDNGTSLYVSDEEVTDNTRENLPERVNDTKDNPFDFADGASHSPPKSIDDRGNRASRPPAVIRSRGNSSSFMDSMLHILSLDDTRNTSNRFPTQTHSHHSTISTERRSVCDLSSGRSRNTTPRNIPSDLFRGGPASPGASSIRDRDSQQWKSTPSVRLEAIWNLTADADKRKEHWLGRESPQEVQEPMSGR